MATISAQMVKELREKTDLPMMECKQALSECNGDVESAMEWLRKKHKGKLADRAGRATGESADSEGGEPSGEQSGSERVESGAVAQSDAGASAAAPAAEAPKPAPAPVVVSEEQPATPPRETAPPAVASQD
jgi:hypothetical protein